MLKELVTFKWGRQTTNMSKKVKYIVCQIMVTAKERRIKPGKGEIKGGKVRNKSLERVTEILNGKAPRKGGY